MGFKIAVYPLTLLSVSIRAMRVALACLMRGQKPQGQLDFEALKAAVGFPDFYAEEEQYKFD